MPSDDDLLEIEDLGPHIGYGVEQRARHAWTVVAGDGHQQSLRCGIGHAARLSTRGSGVHRVSACDRVRHATGSAGGCAVRRRYVRWRYVRRRYVRLRSSRHASRSRTGPRSYSGPLRPTVNNRVPTAYRLSALCAGLLADTPADRSISSGSRPTLAHQSSSTLCLWATVLASPKPCQMSACSATIRRVLRSPPPPIRTGMSRVGDGLSVAQRLLINGRSRSSASRRPPAVPKS